MSRLLDGKIALVTGAGRGFGTGIAQALVAAGASVGVNDLDSPELDQAVAEIAASGGQAIRCPGDVSDFAAMENVVQQIVARWGRLDIVVSNAAILPLISFEETTPKLWHKILGINLTGVYNTVKAAWPWLTVQGGHCIAIASGASVRGSYNEVAYCTAKHGLEGFTKALAMEAEPRHIAVNTMGPGKIIKPTSVSRTEFAQFSQAEQARYADPAELGKAFVWLAAQPPARFTGLRFDAGPLADTIAAEGYDFAFAPEKATLYVDDFVARQRRRQE
ncbi:MAG: SDR family oxidoreductase [Caldilineaceae bacterium]|nr:SDR family oxidoreductase [Caldilineaceae bacterium]